MKRGVKVVTGLGIVAVVLGGAWFATRPRARGLTAPSAHVALQWSGKFRGAMVLPARVNWCPVTRTGWLEGVSGDSGFAIALYERDALTGAPHPLVSSDQAPGAPRPSATAALRWMLKDSALVVGFRARSGLVRVQLRGGLLSGDINGQMSGWTSTDSLQIHGVFRNVPVVTQAIGCT